MEEAKLSLITLSVQKLGKTMSHISLEHLNRRQNSKQTNKKKHSVQGEYLTSRKMEAAIAMSLMVQMYNTAKMTQDPTLNAEVSDFNTKGDYHRNVTVRVLATVIVLINVVTVIHSCLFYANNKVEG